MLSLNLAVFERLDTGSETGRAAIRAKYPSAFHGCGVNWRTGSRFSAVVVTSGKQLTDTGHVAGTGGVEWTQGVTLWNTRRFWELR